MQDTLITVIAIFIAAIVMFVFPVMYIAKSNETIAQSNVQALTNEFVNKIRTEAKITKNGMADFSQKINSTGNKFDIQIKVSVLDENPKKENTTTIGQNLYYDIVIDGNGNLPGNQDEINLTEGSVVTVKVENTNKDLYQMFMTAIMGTNNDTSAIEATATGIVTSTSNI